MAIRVSTVSETWEKDVFTNRGQYVGKIRDMECDLKRFKLKSLVVQAIKGSYMAEMLGRKKGLIIPYSMVESIGDIVIIKHISAPIGTSGAASQETVEATKETV